MLLVANLPYNDIIDLTACASGVLGPKSVDFLPSITPNASKKSFLDIFLFLVYGDNPAPLVILSCFV